MLLDELNLYIALEMAPTPDSGAAVYIDSDFGIQTGVDDFSILTAEDTGIDAMFSPSLAVEFDGFGADFVVAFQWGPDPSQGLNGAGCYEILPDKSVSFVPCLVALSEDGFMEATIPWYLIYGDEPPDHEVSAFVVAALDQAGAKLDTIPTTPIDLFIDIMLFGVPDAQCLVSFCGDGIIDSGEECDDAALNNDDLPDTCRTNCLSPWCGDSVIDAGETCDDGQDNNDFLADHCRTNCTPPYCGDNVLDGDEECDNGIENNDELFDHCRTNCLLPFCGDGVQDSLEQCDQGQDNSDFLPDTCRTDCLLPYCGDNVTDDAEECDDGDDNSNVVADACRENCLAAWCGDEIQDSNEECDLGVNNNDEMPDTCRTNCLMAHCGDGALDDGEECDDGNTADWDGCQADCVVYITQCNDGVKTPNEECDWGDLNNDFEPDACRTTCVFAYCGDGIIDSGEICDDGNQEGGDECGLDCKPYVPFCGNGWIDDGEQCDNGDDNSNFLPDHCRKNCSLPFCGDTVIDSNEVCDKGGANSDELPNACRTNCLPAWCGDSVIDNGEQCDDGPGNANEANKCKTDCTLPECGDGVLDDLYLEECDWGDSNTNELVDSCRTDCLNAHCGDNIIDTGEECDDGNDILGDGCAPDCTIETYVPDPGDIIITEIMQNPAKVYDTLGEYFEVYNTRDYEIDISGWEIADSEAEQHQIANGGPLLVPALGYLVLGIENDIDLNGGILVDYEYSDILLGNGSDELYLSYKGAISDEVAYDGGPDFPDPKGASMNLAPSKFNFIANDNGANWCEAWSPLSSGDKGTPGEANDSCP
jgi:cysteine-rich repeat protein